MPFSRLFVASATDTTDKVRLATRLFTPGEEVAYSLQVLNPKAGAKLSLQVRMFEEGKQIFQGNETPMSSPKAANGVIRLGSKMKAGDYAIQVIVIDSSGPKPKRFSQWTDVHVR